MASPLISPNVEETLYLGSIYARGEFYIPTANYADMVNNDGNFKHYVFGIIAEGDDPEDMAHA